MDAHHKDAETQRSGGSRKVNTEYQAARPFVSLCLCGDVTAQKFRRALTVNVLAPVTVSDC